MSCRYPGCPVAQPEFRRPMCKEHWFTLSTEFRIAIRSARSRLRKQPTFENKARYLTLLDQGARYIREHAEVDA